VLAIPEGALGLHLCNDGTLTIQWHNTTPRRQHKTDKEPLPLVLSYYIRSASMLHSLERHGTGRLACPYFGTGGGGAIRIRLASIQ
jgi:hypothetical protein